MASEYPKPSSTMATTLLPEAVIVARSVWVICAIGGGISDVFIANAGCTGETDEFALRAALEF
ncbi:hypothetical protein AA0229_1391 [Gluconobacter cerinus NRIC 0229]|nr:hypothetical protein AA0229_1391 [Gluconobacter cerinus NRIC 0229]